MQYIWGKEPKHTIRAARQPQEGFALSGVVLVKDQGRGYCYVKFTESDVEKLGAKMPYGIGNECTAFLKVVKKAKGYGIYCCYLDNSKTLPLWLSPTKPAWVKNIKYPENEGAKPDKTLKRAPAHAIP